MQKELKKVAGENNNDTWFVGIFFQLPVKFGSCVFL